MFGLGATGGGTFLVADVFPAKLITESNKSSISFLASWTPFGLARLTATDALAAGGGGGGGAGGAGGGGAALLLPPPVLIPSSCRSLSVSNVMSIAQACGLQCYTINMIRKLYPKGYKALTTGSNNYHSFNHVPLRLNRVKYLIELNILIREQKSTKSEHTTGDEEEEGCERER